jgi:hypothetical protein
MPSLNHYVPVDKHTRIRINTCEGENHVTREVRAGDTGKWSAVDTVRLDDAEALAVADKIIAVLRR